MIPLTGDCPPAADYTLDEHSHGYKMERIREEHARHIKSDAAQRMIAADIPAPAAKALADQMHADARRLRDQADRLAQTEGAEWEVTGKRLRAVGDAGGRVVERVVGE